MWFKIIWRRAALGEVEQKVQLVIRSIQGIRQEEAEVLFRELHLVLPKLAHGVVPVSEESLVGLPFGTVKGAGTKVLVISSIKA